MALSRACSWSSLLFLLRSGPQTASVGPPCKLHPCLLVPLAFHSFLLLLSSSVPMKSGQMRFSQIAGKVLPRSPTSLLIVPLVLPAPSSWPEGQQHQRKGLQSSQGMVKFDHLLRHPVSDHFVQFRHPPWWTSRIAMLFPQLSPSGVWDSPRKGIPKQFVHTPPTQQTAWSWSDCCCPRHPR